MRSGRNSLMESDMSNGVEDSEGGSGTFGLAIWLATFAAMEFKSDLRWRLL